MEYEAVEDQQFPGMWRAEAVDYGSPVGTGDGEVYVVIFSGPNSEGRAREYAIWKNQRERARGSLVHQ